MSLDAVAERAGVSKGGLLYHFPSKTKLLEALVEAELRDFDADLAGREGQDRPDGVLTAYLAEMAARLAGKAPPPCGMLAAAAEDPSLLTPVRHYERRFLDRIRANASDPDCATVAFLAVHGLWMMQLLGLDILSPDEVRTTLARLAGNGSGADHG